MNRITIIFIEKKALYIVIGKLIELNIVHIENKSKAFNNCVLNNNKNYVIKITRSYITDEVKYCHWERRIVGDNVVV